MKNGWLNGDKVEDDDDIEVEDLVGIHPLVTHLVDVIAPSWALPFLTVPFWAK